MTTQTVFLVEHFHDWNVSYVDGIYESWDAMIYGTNAHHPRFKVPDALTVTRHDEDGTPIEWCTDQRSRLGYLQITAAPLGTRTQDAYEVRLKTNRNGVIGDSVARASHNINNKAHAEALAAGWNQSTHTDPTSTYYAHKVTA